MSKHRGIIIYCSFCFITACHSASTFTKCKIPEDLRYINRSAKRTSVTEDSIVYTFAFCVNARVEDLLQASLEFYVSRGARLLLLSDETRSRWHAKLSGAPPAKIINRADGLPIPRLKLVAVITKFILRSRRRIKDRRIKTGVHTYTRAHVHVHCLRMQGRNNVTSRE